MVGVSQCYAQDVAETARQERARKESQQKKSKHIYTNEDLKRGRILTPEDQAQVEAKKNQPVVPTPKKSQEAMDAQSLPPNAPLGDVARHFRRQKELRRLRESAEFHLPLADAPALASPKPPVGPMQPPGSALKRAPARPRFAPYQPPVKRSPFERPKVFTAPPALVNPSHPPIMRGTPVQPVAPSAPGALAKLNVITVKRGDSLWKLAQQNLGKGLRWRDLLSVNPNIHDPNRIVAGSQIFLPAAASQHKTATRISVQKGDTLSQIAQNQLGHASYAACVAHANPAIHDVNLIYAGQVLLLPASCTP